MARGDRPDGYATGMRDKSTKNAYASDQVLLSHSQAWRQEYARGYMDMAHGLSEIAELKRAG